MGWVASQSDIEAALADHPAVIAGCDEVAEAIRDTAQGIAVADAYDSGRFTAGIIAIPGGVGRAARARATVDWSAPLEGGTGLYGPRHAPVVAQNGHPFVFSTHLQPGGGGLSAGLGDVERTLVLWQHNGMPGRHIMSRAAMAVAGESGRLRYHAREWELVP